MGFKGKLALKYLVILSIFFSAYALFAQRMPYVGYIFPAGGKQGTSFTAMLSGQYLDGVLTNGITASDNGIKIEVLNYIKPLNGREITLLRDRLRNIQNALKETKKEINQISFYNELKTNQLETLTRAEAEKEIMEINKKLANPKNQRPPNPQMAEDVLVKITIDKNATVGEHEIRVKTANGHSNPLVFYVSDIPEFTEQETVAGNPMPTNTLSLPIIINGRILPGDVDRFRFRARKGYKLVAAVYARQLIPYLADAVPGWFQATLSLQDSKGKEIAYLDDYKFNPDPIIYYEIPADGEYIVEIKDAIFRGREDFVYRIMLGELPVITSIFPLGGQVNRKTEVSLTGWNLPVDKIVVEPENVGTIMISVTNNNFLSNLVPFQSDSFPEVFEKEPNNNIKSAQEVTFPVIINGRIDSPSDTDVFSFNAEAGEDIVIEVKARRLNSMLDSIVEVTDSNGKRLYLNDDSEDPSAALLTHHADSYIRFTAPYGGKYYVHITDSQHKGGSDFPYRLRISRPNPDFELRIVPSSINLRAGASAPATVYVLRKDGFTNSIKLSVVSPKGFSISGNPTIPGYTNQFRINIYATPEVEKKDYELEVQGVAKVNDKEIVRKAQPAQDMMQAFYYHHLVPSKAMIADIIGIVKPAPKQSQPASKKK